jgi:hypothetical protein
LVDSEERDDITEDILDATYRFPLGFCPCWHRAISMCWT